MPQITLDIPDELFEQLTRSGENPSEWLKQRLPLLASLSLQAALPAHIYRYVLDFIASNPSPQEIADFRPTAEMQERLRVLIARSKSGDIDPLEQAELDEYERIEHIVIMLKAGNLKYLAASS